MTVLFRHGPVSLSLPTHNRLIFLVIVYSVLSSLSPCRPTPPVIFLPLLIIPCQWLKVLLIPCPCQFCVSFSREQHPLTSSLQITIPAGKRAGGQPTQSHVKPSPPPYSRRQHPGNGPAPPAPCGPCRLLGQPQKGGTFTHSPGSIARGGKCISLCWSRIISHPFFTLRSRFDRHKASAFLGVHSEFEHHPRPGTTPSISRASLGLRCTFSPGANSTLFAASSPLRWLQKQRPISLCSFFVRLTK